MKMVKGWKSESARHALARKGIKTGTKSTNNISSQQKTLQLPDKLCHSKILFTYNNNDIPLDKISDILGNKMDLKEHMDYDVAYNQNDRTQGIIFLHTDRAVARVLQSYAFRNEPITKINYGDLIKNNVKIIGV